MEFYPEEGKYHYNGHRKCRLSQSPEQTLKRGSRCPVCDKVMTLRGLHRVQSLAGETSEGTLGPDGFIRAVDGRTPFLRLVQLEEVLSKTLEVGRRSKSVQTAYRKLCAELGNELTVLAKAELPDLERIPGERVAQAIIRARKDQVSVETGFDGQYGTVRVGLEGPVRLL